MAVANPVITALLTIVVFLEKDKLRKRSEDIEAAWQTLNALKALPLDDYRFSVITYETDVYKDGPDAGEEAMKILLQYGYQLVARNVANQFNPYEDWYVDPGVVDAEIVKKFLNTSRLSKESTKCIFV